MKQKSFMFYDNFLEAIEQLPKSERANACYQLCRYALNDELPEDKSMAMFCVGIKYSVHKYQGRGGKREGAGRKKNQDGNQDDFPLENSWGGKREGAGRPKSPENQEKKSSLENQNNQNNQNTQTETETKTETKTEIKRENIERNQVGVVFIPPTEQEVVDYANQQNEFAGTGGFKCSEKDAKEFFNFYAGQGWVTSGNIPIRDWQSKFKGWVLKRNRFKNKQEIEDEEELKPVFCE